MKKYQAQVDKWANQFEKPYFNPLELLARLAEETGEVARETNHLFGAKRKKSYEDSRHLGEELADVIFTVICYANSQKIDLDYYFGKVMEKCYGRDNNRYKRKDNLNEKV